MFSALALAVSDCIPKEKIKAMKEKYKASNEKKKKFQKKFKDLKKKFDPVITTSPTVNLDPVTTISSPTINLKVN